jgi:hypothetical protein
MSALRAADMLFKKEGGLSIYKSRISEAKKCLSWIDKGLMSLHLYVAIK